MWHFQCQISKLPTTTVLITEPDQMTRTACVDYDHSFHELEKEANFLYLLVTLAIFIF